MAKTSVMVGWSVKLYSYLQLTVPQVSDCCPLRQLVILLVSFIENTWLWCSDSSHMEQIMICNVSHYSFILPLNFTDSKSALLSKS